MSRLNSKWFLLFLTVFSLIGASLWARSYVVPTPYGYGMVERHSGVVRPYIVPPTYPHGPYYYGTSYQAYYGYSDPYYYPNTYSYSAYSGYSGYSSPYYQNCYASGAATPAMVTIDRLNLRASPGKDHNVIGTLYYGENVWILAQSGNWYYIQSTRQPGVFGYAYASYFSAIPRPPMNYYSSYPTYYMR